MEPQKPAKTRLAPSDGAFDVPLQKGPGVTYLSMLSGFERSWRIPKCHFLRGDRARLGRSAVPDGDRVNDIVLDADSISRFHAVLERTEHGWVCRDDQSAGGTFINDERLASPQVLKPGDVLRFGPQAQFLCGSDDTSHAQLASELPAPIARLDTAPTTSARAQVRLRPLFITLEKALRFLVGCELAWLRRQAHQDPKLRSELAKILAAREYGVNEPARKLTMGTWRTLATKLASLLPSTPQAPNVVRAARAVLGETQELAEAVELRNVLAHSEEPPDSELAAAMPDLRALAERLIVALSPLVSTRLVSVIDSENLVRGYHYGLYVFTGDRPARLESWTTEAKLLPRWCYLIDAQSEPLLLAPMVAAVTVGGDSAEVLVAPRVALGGEGVEVELSSANVKVRLAVPWFEEVALLHAAVGELAAGR